MQHRVYMCSAAADADACRSSIRGRHGSAVGKPCGERILNRTARSESCCPDPDLSLTAPHLRGPNLQF